MLFFKNYSSLDDDHLMLLIADEDHRAFRELLERHQGSVHGFAFRFLGDAHEAADVAQETFLRIFTNAATYTPGTSFRAWAMRIARNLCLDYVRKKKPLLVEQLPEQPDHDTPMHAAIRQETADALAQAVRRLPESQRTALILRHNEGLRYDEIAMAMDVTVSAVESLLVRARKALRSVLSPLSA
ncbi:RNA polymerase sigma factor [Desulfovibrio ferrophilus]|uniref:RNA polymerase sigma factor, sigma-70 family n=1 Tax=Desulfovibrio ferrophilus TaxID=241368 RepID=A0A2Z6AV40_9BACT|nr:sigma-70 family RNA polymerase sigma factor [Desulfovibrio ferrophilus]BBD07109.1 RNA polymerase sigma factor, sigma-70 family [Desulfovibrio ferrophilus]